MRRDWCVPIYNTDPSLTQSYTGPEVVGQAVWVLETVSELCLDIDLKLEHHLFGGNAIDAVGEPLPAFTLKACQEVNAILMDAFAFEHN
jgi:isocitrate/isopropylmalate dehydrogenase